MNKLKLIFLQAMMISTAILAVIGVEGIYQHLCGYDLVLDWYHPLSILLAGFCCALPTWMLMDLERLNSRQVRIRIGLHCIFLWCIITVIGYLFGWYADLSRYLYVMISYVLIYVFVWSASVWIQRSEDHKINHALRDIQDEE